MAPRIEIAVYDLLPESKISTAFYYLGCGIYHTAIRIPELQIEYAYGGLLPSSSSSSSSKQRMEATGIFSIPSPEDHRIPERYMPGVRFVARIDVGEAFNSRWKRKYGDNPFLTRDKPLPPVPSSSTQSRYPRRAKLSRENSGSALLLGPEDAEDEYYPHHQQELSVDMLCDPSISMLESPESYDSSKFHKGNRRTSSVDSISRTSVEQDVDPRKHAHQRQRTSSYNSDISRIISIVENMKRECNWRATQYQLLTRNCNDFTNELCERLTGKGAPGWLNRAAWLGQSIPCLVPQEWLDPPSVDDIQSPSTSSASSHHDRQLRGIRGASEEHETEPDRPASPLVAIPYLETQPMRLDVHYEGVK